MTESQCGCGLRLYTHTIILPRYNWFFVTKAASMLMTLVCWLDGRGYFVHVPSQWEMMLHCNITSHWLGTCTKQSLWWWWHLWKRTKRMFRCAWRLIPKYHKGYMMWWFDIAIWHRWDHIMSPLHPHSRMRYKFYVECERIHMNLYYHMTFMKLVDILDDYDECVRSLLNS